MLRVSLFFALSAALVWSQGCVPRQLSAGIVCVCNATYCDTIEPPEEISDSKAVVYLTNLDGARMERSIVKKAQSANGIPLSFDASTQYQELFGFGGSFTDSTGLNLLSLSEGARDRLFKSYFGPHGSEYTLGRVPMASTDFSSSPYSYNEVKDDFEMEYFALVDEDYTYKLPFIKQAAALQQGLGGLKLVAAPWSAPAWMKTNNQMVGGGKLAGWEGGPYYVAWAKYFVKFFEAYAAEGVDYFWATEVQNEPRSGADSTYKWQSMYWSPETEANFVVGQLSPALKNSSVTRDLKVIGLTDQRGALPDWPQQLLANTAARSLIDGISLHWYMDELVKASLLSDFHEEFPEKFLLSSEASNGFADPHDYRMQPGDYRRAEKYAHSVIEDLNNFVGGWIDWNLALNMQGGPNWVENIVDCTILVNAAVDEFYKQPSYYALAHFSKFLKPGSRRVKLDVSEELPKHVETLATLSADGRRVLVAMNTDKQEIVKLSIADTTRNGVVNIELNPRSIVTLMWN